MFGTLEVWLESAVLIQLTYPTPGTLFFINPPVYMISLKKHTQHTENLISFPQIAMMKTLGTLGILLVIKVYCKIVYRGKIRKIPLLSFSTK